MKKLTLLLLTFLSLSAFAQKNIFRDQTDMIPPDFGKYKGTILVVNSGMKQVDKALDNAFEKNYTGKYEMIDQEDLYSKSYGNTEKYRYVFQTITDHVNGRFTEHGRETPTDNYSFGILDRSTMHLHKLTFFGGAYKGLMNAYVKKMEEERVAAGTAVKAD